MNELQNCVVKSSIPPAAIKDNAAFSSLVIDRHDAVGASYLEFLIGVGATDIAMAVLKVMESDTKTNDTTLGGTPAEVHDVVSKPGAGATNTTWAIGVDLQKQRKRYLQLQATAGNGDAGTFLSALAVFYRPTNASSLAADRGMAGAEYI